MKHSPSSLKEELDKWVVGNDDAKRKLSIVVYNHYLRYYRDISYDSVSSPPRLTMMLVGPSGSGKTFMVEKLIETLGLPWHKIDCTHITKSGFDGTDIQDCLNNYMQKYKNTAEWDYLDRGILYFDEFDKLGCTQSATTTSANWALDVQNTLLTIIDGHESAVSRIVSTKTINSDTRKEEVIYQTVPLNTKKMLIILSGAFEYVSKNRKGGTEIGFHKEEKSILTQYKLKREELDGTGLSPEILGRVNVIANTERLTRKGIRDLLFNVEDSILRQFESTFLLSGEQLKLSINEIDDLVEKVYNSPYSARYIKTLLFEILEDRMFKLENKIT